MTLGKISRRMIRKLPVPRAGAASTNSRLPMASVFARASRANEGIVSSVNAMIKVDSFC